MHCVPLLYQVRGHEIALQWLGKALNKILLQANDFAEKIKN